MRGFALEFVRASNTNWRTGDPALRSLVPRRSRPMLLALCFQVVAPTPPPSPKVVRIEPPSRVSSRVDTGPRVAIEELETLWTVERRHADVVDDSLWGCTESAWGHALVCIGDNDGDGREELIVANVQRSSDDTDTVESLPDDLSGDRIATDGWSSTVHADQIVNRMVALRAPGARKVVGFAISGDAPTGMFCSGIGRLRAYSALSEWVSRIDTPVGVSRAHPAFSQFAESIGDAGDLDGDGEPDLLAADPAVVPSLRAYSLRTGKQIAQSSAGLFQPFQPAALGSLGDLAGDGNNVIVAGKPGFGGGELAILDAHLAVRARLEYTGDIALFGATAARAPDMNGDGCAEIAIGAPWAEEKRRGAFFIVSGKTFETLRVWRGEREFCALGRCIDAHNDLDGDGVCDIVVGAPGGNGHAVRAVVHVISGRTGRTLLSIDGEKSATGEVWSDMREPEMFPISDAFGWSVATGDFDGDGLADLAIGSPQRGPNHCVGKVYAISAVELRERMKLTVVGPPIVPAPSNSTVQRHSVRITGEPRELDLTRKVRVSELAKLWTVQGDASAAGSNSTRITIGALVDPIGDLDGDGHDDLLVGDQLGRQAMFVSGASGASFGTFDDERNISGRILSGIGARAVGPNGSDAALIALRSSGFGSTDSVDAYCVWLDVGDRRLRLRRVRFLDRTHASISALLGASRGPFHALHEETREDRVLLADADVGAAALLLARTRHSAGGVGGRDIDGDGVIDWCVGTPGIEDGDVEIWNTVSRRRTNTLTFENSTARFGHALQWVDDRNGDGVPELLVGAPSDGAQHEGAVLLVAGKTWTVFEAWRGERELGRLGAALDTASDLDGDGMRDFVFAAPGADWAVVQGAVFVISGRDGRVMLAIEGSDASDVVRNERQSVESAPTSDGFGWDVTTGDFDGDGLADLVIGSPQRGADHCVGKVYAISGVELRNRFSASK